jgi:hypothetical protein
MALWRAVPTTTLFSPPGLTRWSMVEAAHCVIHGSPPMNVGLRRRVKPKDMARG